MNDRILVAAHRGHFGGGIVENTIPAFEAAIRCGADIVEMDIRKTKDGQLILFHDPSPMRLLCLPWQTERYTYEDLTRRPLLNVIGELSTSYVCRLGDALDALKGRCFINFDQCWGFVDEVYEAARQRGMEDQALIKGRVPYDTALRWLEKNDYRPAFIPIITCAEEIAAYRALEPYLYIPQDSPYWRATTEMKMEIESLLKQYAAGMLDGENLIRQLDQRFQLLFLEQ